MTHTPESLDQIAARIALILPDDAATLRDCAYEWRRVERLCNGIVDDAIADARASYEADQCGQLVRFPRMRVGGGVG